MTAAHRVYAVAVVAALLSFSVWGSAIPGFSTNFSRIAAMVAGVSLFLLVFTNRIWCATHWIATFLSAATVAYILARGVFAPFAGGNQRIGVFFMHVAVATGTAMVLYRSDPSR